ncbi:MAG TPA: DUF2807 domain-containing protein [Sediminibacterium sp.]|nr:DUF2807 domain-containing protein [Sediminibacterium sp.]
MKRIEGNGIVKKENRQVGPFTAISSAGSWDVMIADGPSGEIQVEGDTNLPEALETVVEDGKLLIRSKNHVSFKTRNKLTVYVTMDKLNGLSLSGSGDIIGEGRFFNEGTSVFRISGSGNIRLRFRGYRGFRQRQCRTFRKYRGTKSLYQRQRQTDQAGYIRVKVRSPKYKVRSG